MNPSPVGHRAPALWILLPLMTGLSLGRAEFFAWGFGATLAAAAVALLAGWLFPRVWPPALIAGVVLCGIVLHDLTRAKLPAWDALPPREARVDVQITRLFAPGLDAQRVGGLGRIVAAEPHLQELVGQRVYFSLRTIAREALTRDTVIAAVGILQSLPPGAKPGSFEHYLDATGVNFRLQRGAVTHVVHGPGYYRRFCAAAERRFDEILRQGLEDKPALSGIYRAMLLGRKSELSDEQDEIFLQSGTLHLFAISGLHIATIAATLHVLLALLPWPRVVRFALATIALWLYTDITGGTPSAVRAFLMATVLAALPVLRVPGNTLAALALSALVVLLFDPLQVFSASFQMSYGIVAALLVLGLPLAESWTRQPTAEAVLPAAAQTTAGRWIAKARGKTLSALALGAAATVVSTVSGVMFFNLITPGGFVANLVLIPLSVFAVIAGFASLLAGLVHLDALALVFNHAAAFILSQIEGSVRLVVEVPGSSLVASFRAPWLGPVCLAGVLGLMLHGYARQWRAEAGGFWPPFAALGVILLVAVRYG